MEPTAIAGLVDITPIRPAIEASLEDIRHDALPWMQVVVPVVLVFDRLGASDCRCEGRLTRRAKHRHNAIIEKSRQA
jgi:hypothetical protein